MDDDQRPPFVLVHGGRHGGWVWRDVAALLRSWGHPTYTPTLTGLGERSHLLQPDVGLATHVDDLVGVFEFEDLRDVVLVAHSYAGMPVAGALQQVADRVRRVVWLDAHCPLEGESIFGLIGEERASQMRSWAEASGEGWYIPTSDASFWGLTSPTDIAWVNAKTTPQPLKSYTDAIGPTDRAWSHPGTMIECAPSKLPAVEMERLRARAATDPSFHHRVIGAPHEPMVTHAEELAKLLVEAGESP